MRRLSIALVSIAVAVTGAAPAQSAPLPAAKGSCPPKLPKAPKGKKKLSPKQKRKLAKQRRAAAFTVLSRSREAVAYERRGVVFACWRASQATWRLGKDVPVSAVTGDRLAYGAGATVRLLTLSTGEPLDVGSAIDTGQPVSDARVTAVVLRGDGALAWIGEGTSAGSKVQQVRQLGGLLGTGSGMDPASLALDGDRVTWTQSGIERSAPLTLPAPPSDLGTELG